MRKIPAPPFLLRAAIASPLLALSACCLALVAIITPEVDR